MTDSNMRSREQVLWMLENGRPGKIKINERFAGGRVSLEKEANGYEFEWGRIAEEHHLGMIEWKFYLGRHGLPGHGKDQLAQAQLEVIDALDSRLDCVSRDCVINFNTLDKDWMIAPGGLGTSCAMTLVARYAALSLCREWMVTEFIPEIIPEILSLLEGK